MYVYILTLCVQYLITLYNSLSPSHSPGKWVDVNFHEDVLPIARACLLYKPIHSQSNAEQGVAKLMFFVANAMFA